MCGRGFTLIEIVVALLVGAALVLAVGGLSQSVTRQRAIAATTSAATSLAQRKMEELLGLPDPVTHPDLREGAHGPVHVNAAGESPVGAPYGVRWTVVDDRPATPAGAPKSMKITVTVTHAGTRDESIDLETYRKYTTP